MAGCLVVMLFVWVVLILVGFALHWSEVTYG
jgi:hypothetical protein